VDHAVARRPTARRPAGERPAGNRYLNTLSAVFSFGESEEIGWTDHNSVRKVRRKPEPEGRKRFLSRPVDEPESELDRLLEACRKRRNPDLYDLVR
jgi:hypothetical protein